MTKVNGMGILRRVVATTVAIIGVLVSPLAAQQAASTTRAPQQAPAPQGQTLRVSMNEAVAMALEYNLGLKADRMQVDVADQAIVSAKSSYLPQLTSSLSRQSGRSVPSDFTQGITDITSQGLNVAATVASLMPWLGGDYAVSWNGSRNTSIGGNASINPRIGSSLSLTFNQPLWRELKIDAARVNLETSQRNRSIEDLRLQQTITLFEVTVKSAYLNYVGAVEGRKVAQQNMDIVEQSLRNARARVAVGQSPQIDVVQAEAQVANSREALITADGRIGTAEDSLRQLILDPSRPDYWTVRLETTDQIQLTPFQVDLDAAIKNALANRLDLAQARQGMDITDLRMELNKNLTLPSIDLQLRYSASGTAGTVFEFGDGFPPPIVGRADRSFGSALGDTFSGAYPTWSAGVFVGYPIGKTAARASLATAQIQKNQQLLDIRNLELQIVRDVREAARQVQNTYERVQAARTAREASQTQLDAEDRRFQVGLSTTLDQQVRQSQLAQARNAELGAMISYNLALINFERVQKIQ
jgi:outer membrane protein TolC